MSQEFRIETPRLIIRPWKDSDIPEFAKMNQDPEVMEFFPSVLRPEESKSRVEFYKQQLEIHGFGLWAVEIKSTQEFIGFVGLSVPSFEAAFMPAVEIGWRIAKKHWNQSYATEAAKFVLHEAFEKFNLKEVVSFTAMPNKKSMRIMEKIGMSHDPQDDFDHPKLDKDHWLCRHVLYRITKEQLLAQDSIQIEKYSEHWPVLAQQEIKNLEKLLSDFSSLMGIQHIGSTAIPELSAKPIIDLAIGVRNLEEAKVLIPILKDFGYVYWDANPDTTKYFFAKGMPPFGSKRTHHVHVMEVTHHDWLVRPLFRDYLKENLNAKKDYETLKLKLAAEFEQDREAYTSAKTAFIRKMNLKAIEPKLRFEFLEPKHFEVLLKFFNEPHVQAFFSLRTWTLEDIQNKYAQRVLENNKSSIRSWMVYLDQTPIGLIQDYPVGADLRVRPGRHIGLPLQDREGDKICGIDFLMGEKTFLGKKIGALVFNKFAEDYLKDYECLVVDPDVRNQAGIKFFSFLGFEKNKIIQAKDALGREQEYQLMVKDQKK